MSNQTRRITTGVVDNNISKVISNESISDMIPYEIFPSFQIQELFYTEDTPQTLATRHHIQPYNIDVMVGIKPSGTRKRMSVE